MRKHSQHNNDERTHFFRKNIPLTLYSKGLQKGYVWEVSWRLNKDRNIWPPVPPSLAALLSRPAGLLNPRPWGLSSLLGLVLTASNCNNWLQTNWTSCRTGLDHCLTTTCFLWASHLHPIQSVHSQGYTLISSTGCTCSLIDDWVGGQYVTNPFHTISQSNKKELSPQNTLKVCFGLVWFYGISSIVGCFMPNPFL